MIFLMFPSAYASSPEEYISKGKVPQERQKWAEKL